MIFLKDASGSRSGNVSEMIHPRNPNSSPGGFALNLFEACDERNVGVGEKRGGRR